jgi:predicted metal-dependent hydrolase
MPAPDHKHEIPQQHMQKARQIMEQITRPTSESALAHEVAELRREIQALRQDLAPVPSLILTGRAALDEFKRLTQGA